MKREPGDSVHQGTSRPHRQRDELGRSGRASWGSEAWLGIKEGASWQDFRMLKKDTDESHSRAAEQNVERKQVRDGTTGVI